MQILGLLEMKFDAAVVQGLQQSLGGHCHQLFSLIQICYGQTVQTEVTKIVKEGDSILSRNEVLKFQVPLYDSKEITTQI